ncbi:MAG: DUF3313 family protein [Desulfobacteraceae bacterium]|jgi:hypothetical protein
MKNLRNNQAFQAKHIRYLILLIFLIGGSVTCASGSGDFIRDDVTADGLTVMKSTRFTESQIKNGVDWSEYTKYQITPVDVSFRKNWKRDYNRDQKSLSMHVTDKDMARIKKTMGKIVLEELDKVLQKEGGLTKVDQSDSNTLLFKPGIINLDVYAPEVQNAPVISRTYIRQAGRATLFLEVHDAVSGEILARWVDTREDPDDGYFEWANRITNAERARRVIIPWAKRLVEGLDKLKAVN